MPGVAKSVNEGLPFPHRIALSQPDLLGDRDLLETLLRPLAPPDQCSTLAESLLVREGSFRGVFECSVDALSDTVGPSIAYHLRCMNAVVRRMLLSDIKERPLVNCWSELETYLGAAHAFDHVEKHMAMFLDSSNILIRDEVLQIGHIDGLTAYLRRLTARALQLEASAVITVHSRPGHDAILSSSDVHLAKQVALMLGMLGIAVHDHAIVGKNGVLSIRAMGAI
jgi:DNA repair protein RadC